MYVNAIKMHLSLDDPIYHVWKQDDRFPENITDVLETCDGKDDDCVSEYKFIDVEISHTSDSER